MYRFLLRPRWIGFHVLVVGAVVLMINLGFWQLDRLDERREFNTTVTERIEQDAIPLGELLEDPTADPESLEWRQVTAAGTYLAEQILVFNRSQGGRAGDNVLTPLVLDDGRVVLVNRGFVQLGTDVPPPPAGDVVLLGRVRPSEERQRGELTDPDEGPVTEVRRVEIDRIAPQLPGEVVPVYVDLVDSEPAPGADDPTPVPAPELDDGPHLSYAVQWFIFAACVVVGWVLAIRRSVRSRRGRASRATTSPTSAASSAGPTSPARPARPTSPTSADVTAGSTAPTGEDPPPSTDGATPTAPSGTPGSSPR